MKIKKNLQEILVDLKINDSFKENIVTWKTLESKDAKSVSLPEQLHTALRDSLKSKGIEKLYTHQKTAFENIMTGNSIVAVTPTASGKTLCYNLPVLQSILSNPNARALYMFPTKALAQDQKSEINEIIQAAGIDINSYTYDGDTPANIRQKVRKAGHVVITNPDMLHSAILPHHTKWVSLFENLKFVVIDELHTFITLTLYKLGCEHIKYLKSDLTY
jgi:DEAD/DEAH box helicase domain-containing protein